MSEHCEYSRSLGKASLEILQYKRLKGASLKEVL